MCESNKSDNVTNLFFQEYGDRLFKIFQLLDINRSTESLNPKLSSFDFSNILARAYSQGCRNAFPSKIKLLEGNSMPAN